MIYFWNVPKLADSCDISSKAQWKIPGVADLWYERLNMPVMETSIHKAWGFSTYFFHTLIKQRLDCYSNPDFKI